MRLIDADALIENMKGVQKAELQVYGKGSWNFTGACMAFVNAAQTVETDQKWIPVSERLPEEVKKTYWACDDSGAQFECRWTNANPFWTDLTTDWHWNIFDVPQFSKVVAWMPLPEPYKEG